MSMLLSAVAETEAILVHQQGHREARAAITAEVRITAGSSKVFIADAGTSFWRRASEGVRAYRDGAKRAYRCSFAFSDHRCCEGEPAFFQDYGMIKWAIIFF